MRAPRQRRSPQPRLSSLQGWRSHSLSSRPVLGLSFLPAENCFPNIQLVATAPLFYHLALLTSPSSSNRSLQVAVEAARVLSRPLCPALCAPGHLRAGCLVLAFPPYSWGNEWRRMGQTWKLRKQFFVLQQAPPIPKPVCHLTSDLGTRLIPAASPPAGCTWQLWQLCVITLQLEITLPLDHQVPNSFGKKTMQYNWSRIN